jgi:hypothetical protein
MFGLLWLSLSSKLPPNAPSQRFDRSRVRPLKKVPDPANDFSGEKIATDLASRLDTFGISDIYVTA